MEPGTILETTSKSGFVKGSTKYKSFVHIKQNKSRKKECLDLSLVVARRVSRSDNESSNILFLFLFLVKKSWEQLTVAPNIPTQNRGQAGSSRHSRHISLLYKKKEKKQSPESLAHTLSP